jgi:hypothetical protein
MIWNPNEMLIHDVVFKPFGSLSKAGLRRAGRTQDKLLLTLIDGTTITVESGETIPLPYGEVST